MMKRYSTQWLLLVGLCWLSPCLYGQSTLKNLEQVQFLSQNECVVVQVNADWNKSASIDFGEIENCVWFNASIDNKVYGAIIAEEWQIRSVPTIIMFQHGKEIKRFEAGLSFRIDEDEIKRQINKEIEEIMLRRFQ